MNMVLILNHKRPYVSLVTSSHSHLLLANSYSKVNQSTQRSITPTSMLLTSVSLSLRLMKAGKMKLSKSSIPMLLVNHLTWMKDSLKPSEVTLMLTILTRLYQLFFKSQIFHHAVSLPNKEPALRINHSLCSGNTLFQENTPLNLELETKLTSHKKAYYSEILKIVKTSKLTSHILSMPKCQLKVPLPQVSYVKVKETPLKN